MKLMLQSAFFGQSVVLLLNGMLVLVLYKMNYFCWLSERTVLPSQREEG